MGVDEEMIGEIIRRVLTVSKPDKIILFGSAAAENMTRDSDIDLLVLSPKPANTIAERVELSRSLRGLGLPFDVFVMATERFEESKNVIGGLAHPANKYGRLIYEGA